MKYNFTFSLLSIIILLSYPLMSIQTTARTANLFYTFCKDTSNQLPNLSTATTTALVTLPDSYNCNTLETSAANVTVVWSYYNSTNDPANCAPNTASSVLNLEYRVVVNGLGQRVGTTIGSVLSGPYQGLTSTTVVTLPTIDPTICGSAVGLVAQSGETTLTIIGGPVCNGIFTFTFCPGLKN